MKQLALNIPGFGNIPNLPGFQVGPGKAISEPSLGGIFSGLLEIAFFLSAFLSFFWFVWGAFQYIFAGGDKEKLAKARARITWAIVGLLLVSAAFLVSQFVGQILQPRPEQSLPGFSLVPQAPLIPTAYAQAPSPVDIGKEFGLATDKTKNLGSAVGLLVAPTFSIATVAVVIYFLIGAFKMVSAGSDKDAIGSARGMITHAIIGFILLMFAFLILQFIPQAFGIDFSIFK